MKRLFFTLLIIMAAYYAKASSILFEGFEYANHDGETPVGWVCADNSWRCGYLDQDHNRHPHTGNWYAYTNNAESWMFMEMNMSTQLRYRFSLYAITDGGYQLEIWAGSTADPSSMTQLLLSDVVYNGNYNQISNYIDEITEEHQFFGIHAVSTGGGYLTIDDINVDMVEKYSLTVAPVSIETSVAPSQQVEFGFKFINTGYEPLNVYIIPTTEHFTDIHLYSNGIERPTFPAEPDETVEISGVATMLPDIPIGELTWIDIHFELDCGCATAMFTLFATAEANSIDDLSTGFSIYPNPSSGNVTIEGTGTVSISNILGQEILRKEIIEKETIMLENGVYFVKTNDGIKKIVVK